MAAAVWEAESPGVCCGRGTSSATAPAHAHCPGLGGSVPALPGLLTGSPRVLEGAGGGREAAGPRGPGVGRSRGWRVAVAGARGDGGFWGGTDSRLGRSRGLSEPARPRDRPKISDTFSPKPHTDSFADWLSPLAGLWFPEASLCTSSGRAVRAVSTSSQGWLDRAGICQSSSHYLHPALSLHLRVKVDSSSPCLPQPVLKSQEQTGLTSGGCRGSEAWA